MLVSGVRSKSAHGHLISGKDERNEIFWTLLCWTIFFWVFLKFRRTWNAICVRSWEAKTYQKHPVACRQFDNSWMSVLPQLCDSFLIAERQHATDGLSHKLVRRVGRSLLVCLWLRGNWVLPIGQEGHSSHKLPLSHKQTSSGPIRHFWQGYDWANLNGWGGWGFWAKSRSGLEWMGDTTKTVRGGQYIT